MQIVIKIPDSLYEKIQNLTFDELDGTDACMFIRNGTPLPKGHGRIIDKDHMIVRLEAASKFYGDENADDFDKRFSYGLKEAAIKVAEEPTIIEADKAESEGV